MTVYERLLAAGLGVLFLGTFGLILGLKLGKRKPILISPKTIRKGGALVFLPTLIVSTFRLAIGSVTADSILLYLSLSVLVVLISVILYALLILSISWCFWLFNVTETILIEALGEALQEHGIEYSLRQTKSPNITFQGARQVTVDLPGTGSSIKVRMGFLGRAWLWFVGRRHIRNCDKLISDFECALKKREYNDITAAFPLILVGIVSISAVIYGTAYTFLK